MRYIPLIAACLSVFVAAGSADAALEAWWRLDETTGQTVVDQVGVNHGTLGSDAGVNSNDPVIGQPGHAYGETPGYPGNAYEFDGGNDTVIIPDDPSIGADVRDAITVSMWVNSDELLTRTGGGSRVLEKGDSYFFLQAGGLGDGGMIFLVKQSGNVVSASSNMDLQANTWYHLAGTYDGSNLKMYVNGELKGSTTMTGQIDDDGLPMRIGSDDAGVHFDGRVDDVAVFSNAWSEDAISLMATRQATPGSLDQMVVYDAFSYATGPIDGKSGGDGPWSAAWNNTNNTGGDDFTTTTVEVVNVDTPLEYVGGGIRVAGDGKAMRIRGHGQVGSESERWTSRQFAEQSGDLYASFLTRLDGTLSDADLFDFRFLTNAAVPTDGTHAGRLGIKGGIDFGGGDLFGEMDSVATHNIQFDESLDHLFVVKVSKVGGSDTYNRLEIWLDPALADSDQPLLVINQDTGQMTIDGLRIMQRDLDPGDNLLFDQLRVGTTWDSVVSAAVAIPEPAGVAGLLVGAALLRSRRRRA